MTTAHLTKSLFQSGRQCTKRLWLEVHRRDLMEWNLSAKLFADEGTRLGEVARQVLSAGLSEERVDVPDSEFDRALVQTHSLISDLPTEKPILFEAAFEYDGVRVRVDALMRFMAADRLIEVKAGTKPRKDYLWDCALQTWVVRGAGRSVRTISLALVSGAFVYTQEGNYSGLFLLDDYTEEVEELLPYIPPLVSDFKVVMGGLQPDISVGRHCTEPYDCPFLKHCSASVSTAPKYPVEDLPRAGAALLAQLRAAGAFDLRDIPIGVLETPLHQRVAESVRTGKAYVSPDIGNTLNGLPYPRHYLDFESIAFVVPRWIGTRPYQQVPFQFSCHIEHADGRLEHREFLDLTGEDPSPNIVAALLDAIGDLGSILVWHQTFEIGRIRELAEMYPEHATTLHGFISRVVDLLKIFKEHYYHRDMHGSWSIKKVLPTIAPDLSYGTLEISDGEMAQVAYRRAIATGTSQSERESIRRNLLSYCALDTLAMVRLAQWRPE